MVRVGVFGAGGRMGAEVCRAVAAAPDMDLVAAVDPAVAGRPLAEVAGLPGSDLVIGGDARALAGGKAEVAVDFTVAASALENIRWCLGHGVHAVVGTTGISPEDLESVLEPSGGEGHVVYAPNFAIGAVMMIRFSRLAAAWLPDAEVIEAHHASKRDSRRWRQSGRSPPGAPGPMPSPPPRLPPRWRCYRGPGGPSAMASTSTACGSPASSPTRRSSSGGRARPSRSATTPPTGLPSCRECSWRFVRSGTILG